MTDKQTETEEIQRIIARHVAMHPVGRNLALIGGFRYRFLDRSVRASDDIDYHWAGDLEEKQKELIETFRRGLLSEVSRLLGYSGRADSRKGPDADSPAVRIVDLCFWKEDVPHSRIEIPVEVTRIICADGVEVRTADGTVYATASEGDLIESKVIAILGRSAWRHRDIVDVFLFQDRFPDDTAQRLKEKRHRLKMNDCDIRKKLNDLRDHAAYHARAVQEVIDTQLDTAAAAQLNDSGGGKMVLDAVVSILHRTVDMEPTHDSD